MSSTAASDVPSGTWVVMVTRYSTRAPYLDVSCCHTLGAGAGHSARSVTVPAGCRPRCDLLAELLESGDVDLGEGREGLDRVREDVEGEVAADRQRGLLQPFTRLGSERVGADQPFAVAQQGDEPLVVGVGTVYVAILAISVMGTVAL